MNTDQRRLDAAMHYMKGDRDPLEDWESNNTGISVGRYFTPYWQSPVGEDWYPGFADTVEEALWCIAVAPDDYEWGQHIVDLDTGEEYPVRITITARVEIDGEAHEDSRSFYRP